MPLRKNILKISRQLHLYLGVFATPAILFFAITGFLQTFSLHETTRGSEYKPPKLFVQLGQLHKKQTLVVPEKKGPALAAVKAPSAPTKPDEASAKPAADKVGSNSSAAEKRIQPGGSVPTPQAPEAKKQNLWPMKIFFAVISFSLLLSTFTGLYMAYKYVRNKTLVTTALLSGILIPILLLLF